MIETAYVKGGRLYAVVNGSKKDLGCLSGSDRLEGFTSVGVTYVKNGRRYLWSENGSKKDLGSV